MEKIGNMVFYTNDEVKDKILGKEGTPRRDAFDRELEADLLRARIGNRIREVRKDSNLTQAQLGERIGVKSAEISKIENGRNISIDYLCRILQGLGIGASLDFKGYGAIKLC